MYAVIRWTMSAVLLTACNHSSRTDKAGPVRDTRGTPAVMREARGGDIFYSSDTLPAASSPGMLIGLTLHATGDAEMSTDYLNFFPEMITAGPWQQQGDTVSMMLRAAGAPQAHPDTMVFLRRQHELRYLGRQYGAHGLVLRERARPGAAPRVLVMWIHPQKTTCTGLKGQQRQCLQIAFSKMPPDAQTRWQVLPEDIKRFNFQPGRLQQVKVLRTPQCGQLAAACDYKYELLAVLSNH